jgi:hypothetical protein
MAGLSGFFMKTIVKGTSRWFGNGSVKFLQPRPHEKRGQDHGPDHPVGTYLE